MALPDIEKCATDQSFEPAKVANVDGVNKPVRKAETIGVNVLLCTGAASALLFTLAVAILVALVFSGGVDMLRMLFSPVFLGFGGAFMLIFILCFGGCWLDDRNFRKALKRAFLTVERIIIAALIIVSAFVIAGMIMGVE